MEDVEFHSMIVWKILYFVYLKCLEMLWISSSGVAKQMPPANYDSRMIIGMLSEHWVKIGILIGDIF